MTDRGKSKAIVGLSIGLVLAIGFASHIGVRHSLLRVRTALAQEQVAILTEMRDRATNAQPKEAAGYLSYVVAYYPSGTKQVAGSDLDVMVETVRAEMIRQIIDSLRGKTDRDLGSDPRKWIAEYATERTDPTQESQQAAARD